MELAAADRRLAVQDDPVVGTPVPLSPLQREFLLTPAGQARRAPTVVRVLETRRPIEPDVLERAAHAVAAHHPALRLRVRRDAGGRPVAEVAPDQTPAVRAIELDGEEAVAEALDAERRAADCQRGPGLRVLAIRLPERALVALVADHLVLDACSWWALERDLEAAIDGPQSHQATPDEVEDAAYLRWLRRLAGHPATPAGLAGAAYWRAWPPVPLPEVPLDGPGGPRTEAHAVPTDIALSREETAALGPDLPAALLAAVHAAWREWTGWRALPIWLVHHGRRGPLADRGAAGMVGCAAHLFPLLIDLVEPDPIALRRQLDRVPNEGVDYGLLRHRTPQEVAAAAPGLVLDFAGTIRRELNGPVFARVVPELGGMRDEPDTIRELAFGVRAGVESGSLRMRWTYCRTAHRPETVERLAARARRALQTLGGRCSR